MLKTLKNSTSLQSGFSLVELAVVIAVVGALSGAALMGIKPAVQKIQTAGTEKVIKNVNKALSAYVERNNRLPCPALPAAAPFGAAQGECSATPDGIVPFRELGLKEDDIRDGYGNFLTYHVSPIFTAKAGVGGVTQDDLDKIHADCRNASWIKDESVTLQHADKSKTSSVEKDVVSDEAPILGTDIKVTGSGGTYAIGSPDGVGSTATPDGYLKYNNYLWFRFPNPVTVMEASLFGLKKDDNISISIPKDADEKTFVRKLMLITEDMIDASGHVKLRIDANDFPDLNLKIIRSLKFETNCGCMAQLKVTEIAQGEIPDGADAKNLNPAKARFCCPMRGTDNLSFAGDIEMVDADGQKLFMPVRSNDSGEYKDKDELAIGSPAGHTLTVAYTLVSHGKNGLGAYLPNGTRKGGATPGADETENSNGDKTFVAAPRGADFDDIVVWKTQDDIYSEFSGNSCNKP